VLGEVISLIDEQGFTALAVELGLLPGVEVFLD
jgi:hypothetical protein